MKCPDPTCGTWRDGGLVLCDQHLAQASRDYPQGWNYYPGDVCPHGKYTGGSGIDWMCGACEMADDYYVWSEQ